MKQKLFIIKKSLSFCKYFFLLSNALLKLKKYISPELITFIKKFKKQKRVFVFKCFTDVLNNIFHKLKKKSFIKVNLFII